MIKKGITVLGLTLLAACGGTPAPPTAATGDDPDARAEALARRLLMVDTHIDIPYRLNEKMEDISQRTEGGDFDYPRAVAGGLDAAFMSIYIPSYYQEEGGGGELAESLIEMVEGFAEQWPDKFTVVTSPAEVRAAFEAGLFGLALGMENGAPIETDLSRLADFHQRGIRYITLTHGENNAISDSSYADERQWGGLSPFGRAVVAEMNRLGIMIDISHVSDAAFDQTLELTQAPVIASHSSCRHFTPGMERNLDDERILALAANGGVLHINFGSPFLRADAYQQSKKLYDARDEFLAAHGLTDRDKEASEFVARAREADPPILADVSEVADHIDHVVDLVGIDHVGLGSDFDGVGPTTPTGLRDVSQYPNLLRELLARGYTETDIAKICSGNLLRVWEAVERLAAAG